MPVTLTAAERIKTAWHATLLAIHAQPGLPLTELAAARGVALATIHSTLAGLERHKLVRTHRDFKADHAPRRCHLTAAGRTALGVML